MKIERIAVENFLGLKRVDIAFGPITGIFGDNWSGKSSLQQALRLAIAGEVERVSAKGDYNLLVREGAKKAEIQVKLGWDGVSTDVTLAAVLHSSKAKNSSSAVIPVCQDPILPALLDQHRFSEWMEPPERRELVFQVGRIQTEQDEVARRLKEAGIPAPILEEIDPFLRQGFDGAVGYVADKLKALRSEWKGITQEVYGKDKAVEWAAKPPQPMFAERSQIVAGLPKLDESVKFAEGQEAKQQQVVDRLKESANPEPEKCKQCDRMVAVIDEDAQEARTALPRHIEALAMLQRATANRRAARNEGKDFAAWLQTIDAECQQKTDKAKLVHATLETWQQLAALIAWDGIPSELAGKVTKQLNDRLTETAAVTRWPIVQIRDDMEITVGNRLWGLCSEAERWTADAAICEALAWVSGHKFLVLDRMDVLHALRRGDLFYWLETIQAQGVQSIVFATLKQKPSIDGVTAYWLEAGEVAREKATAES